jgi:enoyl-CoA hydratase
MYDALPEEVIVEIDGPVRIVRINRPDDLNAVNPGVHRGLAEVWPLIDADPEARAAVITGNGRAFSAGGDFALLEAMANDHDVRRHEIEIGRQLVLNMIHARVPVVAAVNGPAVGLGCSLVALSDVVYMAESAHLADPHVVVGLVAADGGPITWPLMTSLQLAKEFAFTGDRISAARAAEIGLANHVVAEGDDVMAVSTEAAHRLAGLPQQATEATKRVMNIHLERAVLATLDYAMAAESATFDSDDLRANLERMRR